MIKNLGTEYCVIYRDSVYTYLQFLNLQCKTSFCTYILYILRHGVVHVVLGILENFNNMIAYSMRV